MTTIRKIVKFVHGYLDLFFSVPVEGVQVLSGWFLTDLSIPLFLINSIITKFLFFIWYISFGICYAILQCGCLPDEFLISRIPHFYQKGNKNSKTISSESGDLGIVKIFKTLSVSSWYVLRISKDRLFKTSIICYRGKNTRAGIIPNILVLHVSPL